MCIRDRSYIYCNNNESYRAGYVGLKTDMEWSSSENRNTSIRGDGINWNDYSK